MKTECKIKYRFDKGISIIDISDTISNEVAVNTRKKIISIAYENRPKGIVLHLHGNSISSLGIGCIIAIYQDLLEVEIKLVICLSQKIREIFIQTKLHRILDLFLEEADSIHYIKHLTHRGGYPSF